MTVNKLNLKRKLQIKHGNKINCDEVTTFPIAQWGGVGKRTGKRSRQPLVFGHVTLPVSLPSRVDTK